MKQRFIHHVGLQPRSDGTWAIPLAPHHLNGVGVVHGGVLFTLADTAMGAALIEGLEPGQAVATVDCKISYLKPLQSGEVRCEARVLHRGRNLAHTEADLLLEGVLVARASATFAILPRKPAATP